MPERTRRFHRKSRNGCAECKRRHIRCDGRKPSCANCEAAERPCCFPAMADEQRHEQDHIPGQNQSQRQKQKHSQRQRSQGADEMRGISPGSHQTSSLSSADNANGPSQSFNVGLSQTPDESSHSFGLAQDNLLLIINYDANPHCIPSSGSPVHPRDLHTPPATCYPGLLYQPDVVPKAIFTPQHMILLHHADKVPNVTGPNRSAVDIAVRRAIDSPYFLDELLAFTAFHMAHLYPGSADYFRHLATELQTRALTSFSRLTRLIPLDDQATAVPRVLFSAILGRHVFADTLTYFISDFRSFIDRLVECLNLNRGVMAVVPPIRQCLHTTELQPFFGIFLEAQKNKASSGTECEPLHRLMDRSDLSETSAESCRQAIQLLQWSFNICQALDKQEYPQAASAFSVKADGGFVDLLRKNQPEALVILAYYGVLLHRCDSFWAFGNAGAPLIRLIARHLGSHWQEAMEWPLFVLETEPNLVTTPQRL